MLWIWRRGFDTRGCFLLRLPNRRLSGCCGLGVRLLRFGRLSEAVTLGWLGASETVREGFVLGWSGGSGLDGTSPTNDVIPPLAQVHLLGRGLGPLSIRNGGVAYGGALSDTLRRLHCKGRFRFFPLNTSAASSRCTYSSSNSTEAAPTK